MAPTWCGWQDARIEDVLAGDELVLASPDDADHPRAARVVERVPSPARGTEGWFVRVHDDARPLWFPLGASVRCRPRIN
jgi:hypothetical protein